MALRQPYMIKNNFGAATAALSITAKPGESLRIKGLRFGALASRGFAECFIDRVSVGFWYIGDINANHLEQWSLATLLGNVFKRLVDKGLFAGYPVGEGQTFEVKPRLAGTTVIGAIEYEIADAADNKPEMPNGSNSKEFLFLNYGTNTTQALTTAWAAVDLPRNPSEYPAFPFGNVVPAKMNIDILGFLFMDWKDSAGTVNPEYTYLKLIKERQTLFDEDRNGIYVREGMGQLTWGPCRQTNVDIELFPVPLSFKPGDELTVQISAGSKTLIASGIDLVAIERVTLLE
jgi:hypothetical protein